MGILLVAALAVADIEIAVTVDERAVLLATIEAGCAPCDWAERGREAAMLRLTLDDRYVQHVATVRRGDATYEVILGTVEPGTHRLRVAIDRERSAAAVPADLHAVVRTATMGVVPERDPRFAALSHAPFVYERANTAGRFSDVPVFMYYEIEPTPRGTRYRYTVIFTNEDGGTPADRLMATWGRTTDIEYVYSVELDRAGAVIAHDYQGPEHEVLPYRAALEQRHARLWVVTDNNMLLDRGTTTVRFAPRPVQVDLGRHSREVVMDQHPWLYAVAAEELVREGKVVANAPPERGVIPDPRTYVYVEGCGTVGTNAVTVSVDTGGRWISSDRGVAAYRVVRDGCFRVAIPLPGDVAAHELRGVRIQAWPRPNQPQGGSVRFTDLNTMFVLDPRHVPGRTLLEWHGTTELHPGGAPFELRVP